MSNEFQIPARPWSEADVAHLIKNARNLDADIRAELGLAEAGVQVGDDVPEGVTATDTEVETLTQDAENEETDSLTDTEVETLTQDAENEETDSLTETEEETVENLDAKQA